MVLEALFHGEIYPSENVVPKSDKFRQNGMEMTELMNYFEQKLSPEDYDRLEQLCNRHCDEGNMTNEEQFKYGFTMGALLMCEVFCSPYFPKTE